MPSGASMVMKNKSLKLAPIMDMLVGHNIVSWELLTQEVLEEVKNI